MKKKLYNLILLTGIFILISIFNHSYSQPSNNDCTGAILITTSPYSDMGGTYTDVNTSGATASSPNPSCITSSDNNDDVWYKFVAQTETALLRVHSNVYGLAFCYALYDGCGGIEIACNNAMGTLYANEALGSLTPGNTYYLRFWSQFNFTFMGLSFSVQDINPITPGNESTVATPLTINAAGSRCISPQFFTTAGATRSSPNPSCNADNDDDVWFQFTHPAHSVNIYPEEGVLISSGDFLAIGMEIIDANSGLTAACILYFGIGSTSSFTGAPGHIYYIRIWTIGTGGRGVFSLCLQNGFNLLPPNDTCAAAENLLVGSGVCTNAVTGNLYNANQTPGLSSTPSCANTVTLTQDVWYKVTIPASGNAVVQTSATNTTVNDLVMMAYSGSCGALTQIACDDDGNLNPWPSENHSRISLAVRTPGEIIYVRVVPRNTANKGEFSICAFDETATGLPELSIDDVSKNEGDAGTKKYSFTINLSAASSQTVKVKYKTLDGTATAPEDYASVGSTLVTFNPGEVAKTIKITVNGDTAVEGNETFKVKLLNPLNAVITNAIGTGTIKDDDAPSFAFSNNAVNATANKTGINVYPNPATDIINIDFLKSVETYNISITDITGRKLKQFTAANNQKKITLPVNELQNGIYLITIRSNGESRSFKFVKQ